MTETSFKRENLIFCAIMHMYTCIRDRMCTVASKSRLIRLRVRHSWFTSNCSDIMRIYTFTLHNLHARKKHTKTSFSRFLIL